jgi:outer membrane protein assembly factor BamA
VAYSGYSEKSLQSQLGADGELLSRSFERNVALIRVNHSFDRRDSRLEPTVGYSYNTGLDLAGGVLGGTSDYVRGQAGFTLYHPLTKVGLLTIGAVNLDLGYIRPTAGSELFYLDRFYTGGQNSIRGFRYRGIWVRDAEGRTVTDEFNVPLGGDAVVSLNLEYHLVVGGPFRILAFADFGNVYLRDDIDLGRMRRSAGLELRVNVPVFGAPLRFIFAENLDPFDDDRFESFQFSIGPSF